MKKLLILVLMILLGVLAGSVMIKGVFLGDIEILSIEKITRANDALTADIYEANSLLKQEYPIKKEELSAAVSSLLESKEEYFDLAKISTENEISKANRQDTYLIEYLWTRIGRHATSKGVNIKIEGSAGDHAEENMRNLAFSVEGQYVGIIQFISSLENDDKLNFKIENFKMVKNSDVLLATFNVRNIRIKVEKTNTPSESEAKEEQKNQTSNGQTQNQTTNQTGTAQ